MAVCAVYALETHEGLNWYFGVFSGMYQKYRWRADEKLRYGREAFLPRFGFSDILTCFLALDTYVELSLGNHSSF